MKPRVIAVIQGRMNSSRLPGKILADIAGQPMLQRVFMRTSQSAIITETIFATTTDASDDPVAEYCDFSGIPFTRGSQFDVLDRYYQTAKQAKADVIVRITADCPVIDPTLIDDVINSLLEDQYDFVCNRLPPPYHRTYPIGLDVEACTFKVLEKAWREAKEPRHREHAMPYLYEGLELTHQNRTLETGTSSRGFNIALLHHTTDFGDYRWTVDTPEDLEFMRQIYSRFDGRDDFTWKEVLDLVHNEPQLMKINASVQHKTLKDIDERSLYTKESYEMKSESYWSQIETAFNKVNIYDGPTIFLGDYKELQPYIGNLLAAHWMLSEFLNGGILQFFLNPTGVLAPEAVLAFRRMGLSEISDVIQEAMDYFGEHYPRSRDERIVIIASKTGFGPDEITELFNANPFEELDEKLDILGNNDFEKVYEIMDEYSLKES